MTEGEKLAREFHVIYERLAPSYGYETRKETRDFHPYSPNGLLMIAVCEQILAQLKLSDLESIRDLARDMREKQKQYFKMRSGAVLIEAKQLEAKLDKALNELDKRKLSDSDNDEIAAR